MGVRCNLPMVSLCISTLVTAAWLTLAAPPPALAGPGSDTEGRHHVHRQLCQLDRFLDHHPLIENDLRLTPSLATDNAYLGSNPALQHFLTADPEVIGSLQSEARHLLHRALIRESNTPIQETDVAQLDPLFAEQPAIERQLVEDPARIRDSTYVALHPELGAFLEGHPFLKHVFQPDVTTEP